MLNKLNWKNTDLDFPNWVQAWLFTKFVLIFLCLIEDKSLHLPAPWWPPPNRSRMRSVAPMVRTHHRRYNCQHRWRPRRRCPKIRQIERAIFSYSPWCRWHQWFSEYLQRNRREKLNILIVTKKYILLKIWTYVTKKSNKNNLLKISRKKRPCSE